jgi:hypothetical protein
MTVQLPKDRRLKILNQLRTAKKRIYKKNTTSVKTLTTLIGMFSATKIQFPKTSLPQTPFYNSSYLCQRKKIGHMDSMAPSNISRAPMVEQNNKGEPSSFNYERSSSASSDYNRCSPRSIKSNSSDSEE